MPGPKMGPRPQDFDEDLIRQSPTFAKWLRLEPNEKLRYACRDFIRGHAQDEERLMRRIMIARRNNLRDHEILKRARKTQDPLVSSPPPLAPPQLPVLPALPASVVVAVAPAVNTNDTGLPPPLAAAAPSELYLPVEDEGDAVTEAAAHAAIMDTTNNTNKPATSTTTAFSSSRKRRPASTFSDTQVAKEMDVPAVEATRSYKSWAARTVGSEFVYNQKYIKGKDGHDWLLRKNIWRRMRYRRENKKIVTKLKEDDPTIELEKLVQQQNNKLHSKGGGTGTANGKMPSDIVESLSSTDIKKRGVALGRTTRSRITNGRGNEAAQASKDTNNNNKRYLGESTTTHGKEAKIPKLEIDATPPPLEQDSIMANINTNNGEHSMQDMLPSGSHHHSTMNDRHHQHQQHHHDDIAPPPDDDNHAALTAAAAGAASGGADDLVELSAVEAAVAAAASYVRLANQQQQQQQQRQQHNDDNGENNSSDDDDNDEVNDDLDPTPATEVHNPLEAAANAAALDSAAKLAAAAAAQMNDDDDDDDDEEEDNEVDEGEPVA